MKKISLLLSLPLIIAFFSACSDEQVQDLNNLESVEDFTEMEAELTAIEGLADNEDALRDIEGLRLDGDTGMYLAPPCATRTWEGDSLYRELTIDFGDVPCLGRDGLYRRGIIKITYEGPRRKPGAKKTVEFLDYYVMNRKFNGVKVTEYLGNATYKRTVTDMTVEMNGKTATWNSSQTIERIEGHGTPQPWDDIYLVNGSGSGVNRMGVSYESVITEPLIRKMERGCIRNFVDGVVEITEENGDVILLDYDPVGGAPCDRLASVTRDGETRFITLR